MISDKNVANAVGGKTARACDSCIRKRARWYCAADDAFLCQSCDALVHSANPLARRHERVRLKIASLKSLDIKQSSIPTWHQGFKRKARTPRNQGNKSSFAHYKIDEQLRNPIPFVPEVDQISHEDNNEEEQLLYRVPMFDPFVAELCTTPTTTVSNETDHNTNQISAVVDEKMESKSSYNLSSFLPSEMDLADFAADVESLLGRNLENESFRMEDLGLVDCKEENNINNNNKKEFCLNGKVKVEYDEEVINCNGDMGKEEPPFQLSFDYDSANCGEEDEKFVGNNGLLKDFKEISNGDYEDIDYENKENNINKKRKILLLSLDYEAVISAWSTHNGASSPWTTGSRPDVDPDECWPDCMEIYEIDQFQHSFGDVNGLGSGHPAMSGGGREARVLRYREKRRTRLFSKKIRYEVRKLNAEKRPRMKGRFVKRATFTGGTAANFPIHTK